jgi:hypothetical protein
MSRAYFSFRSNPSASNVRGGDRPPDTVGDHPRSSCAFSSGHEACGSADHSSIRASKAIASFGPARGHILIVGPPATAGTKSSVGCFPSTLCPPEIRAWVADAPPGWGERSASGELVDLPGVVRLLRFPHRQHNRRDIPGHRQLGQVRLGPVLELSVVTLAERI